jgi:Zn-dependent protease with chaperone function
VIVLKLLVFIGGFVWVVVRALHVSFEPPAGIEIKERDAPELFAMLHGVRRAIRAPRLHRVLLDDQANASIAQIPRGTGLLGSRNYLVLGFPYVAALTPDELRAVAAHELGHLSRRHGRFGSFVYRVRATWLQLLGALEERRSIWTAVIRGFFEWYVPYFNAYAVPVARAHELEADDAAAQVTGPETAAASLAAGLLASRWVNEAYWPDVYRAAETSQAPPRALATLVDRIAEAGSYGNVEAAFRALVEEETEVTSSHPSLGERLEHLGVEPKTALAPATASARPSALRLLGSSGTRLQAAVDAYWRARVASDWRAAHREVVVARRRLSRLADAPTRTPQEEFERAALVERFEGPDAALPLYHDLLGRGQEGFASFEIGRILLERDDQEGLAWLDRAIGFDPESALRGSALAADYLAGRGREEEAEQYSERAKAAFEVVVAAFEERASVSVDDRLEPARLPEAILADVRTTLLGRLEVVEAYLVRKRLEVMDETRPLYVLAYVLGGAYRGARAEAEEARLEALDEWLASSIHVPGELMVARIDPESAIGRQVGSLEDGLIYRRG